MVKKIVEKEKAIKLRREGLTYGQIGKEVKVSKQSLSLWLKDIPFEPRKPSMRGKSKAFLSQGKRLRAERIERTKGIMAKAKIEIGGLSRREVKLAGAVLYWAEGTKVDEEVCISNSDPRVINFALRWFREICEVPEEKIKIQMHIHTDVDHEECLQYWMEITKIPRERFTKTYIKKSTLGHRKNPLYYGTIKIRINDKNLHRKIMGWVEGIAESK